LRIIKIGSNNFCHRQLNIVKQGIVDMVAGTQKENGVVDVINMVMEK